MLIVLQDILGLGTPFEVVVYELNYSSEDKELMDLLRTKAEELARQVNPGAANLSLIHISEPTRPY